MKNKFEVVGIPEYLVKTLESKGSSLIKFGEQLMFSNSDKDMDYDLKTSFNNTVISWLSDNLATIELADLVNADNIVIDMLYHAGIGTRYRSYDLDTINSLLSYGILNKTILLPNTLDEYKVDLINMLSNENISLNTIILNNNTKEIFELVITDRILFVVMKSGFTNFLRFKDLDFVTYFRKHILNSMFNAYGEKAVTKHTFFKRFLRL